MQKLTWKATDDVTYEDRKLKSQQLGAVEGHESKMWVENFNLDSDIYPNSRYCSILLIIYELEIRIYVDGTHSELDMKIPLVIGDVQ